RLSDDGQKKESGFNEARFNISYSTPIAPKWRFLTDATIAATGNWETSDYNTVVSDLSVGLARRAKKHQFIGRIQGQNYRLGDHTYRNLLRSEERRVGKAWSSWRPWAHAMEKSADD